MNQGYDVNFQTITLSCSVSITIFFVTQLNTGISIIMKLTTIYLLKIWHENNNIAWALLNFRGYRITSNLTDTRKIIILANVRYN